MTWELPLNDLTRRIQPSATLTIAAKAGELRRAGHPVVDLSVGEPDFKPPRAVVEATAARVVAERVGYAPVPGLPELRAAYAEEFSRVHGREVSASEVLISNGAKHSIASVLAVTLSPGDEVVIPAPYWVSYPDMVRLAGGTPVVVATRREDRYKLDPDALARALGPRTRFVIVNSPSNPTGIGYAEAELRTIGEVITRHAPSAWILSDDIYRRLAYGSFHYASPFRTLDGLTDRIVAIDGVSKTYAMTGFRIGALLAPKPVIDAAAAIQGQTTSGAATPSQWAALAALRDPATDTEVAAMCQAFTTRRDLMVEGLAAIEGLALAAPDGAFYVFPDVSARLGGRYADDVSLAKALIEERYLAVVPGSAFGAPGHLRLSFAAGEDALREGLRRLAAALADA
jgi:aspartate aminotransferase